MATVDRFFKQGQKDFFRTSKVRKVLAMIDKKRDKSKTDKYLRDTIVVTAHARNLGLE